MLVSGRWGPSVLQTPALVFGYVLVIPWFVHMYDVIMHKCERVHYRTYMCRTMVHV